MVRLEVLHHNEDEPGIGRQMSKELFQRLKTTRGRAQADEQGRRTLAFVSGIDTRRDVAIEVFTLEPAAEDGASPSDS